MTRDKAAAEAERLSALMPPENRIEIRQRAGLQWQEIVVHGKVVHDAKEYTILNDEEWLKEKGFWVLAAKFNGMYGVIAVEAYTDEETGELISGAIQLIPYEYTWASNHDGTGPMISCTTRSVTRHYFNYTGWQFSLDARTGKYTGMQKRWVYDELTGKWSLQTVADGEVSFARWVPDPATGKLTLKNQ
jgi:hypothetical protein